MTARFTDERTTSADVHMAVEEWLGKPIKQALCTSVTSNDRRLRVDGSVMAGWFVVDVQTHRELAHYHHEPGDDAFVVLQRWQAMEREEAGRE